MWETAALPKKTEVGREKRLNLTGNAEKGHFFLNCALNNFIYCNISVGL